MRTSRIFSLAITALLTLFGSEASFAQFQSPVTIKSATAPERANQPHIAASSDGLTLVAVWKYDTGSSFLTQASVGTINGTTITWSTSETISETASGTVTETPKVHISSDGTTAVAIWSKQNV